MSLIFTWDDLKRIFKAQQKKIFRLSLFCAVIAFLYFLIVPLKYEASATFKQSSARGDQGLDIKNLLRSFSSSGSEGVSTTLMLSDVVLEKTIEELGLQAELRKRSRLVRLFQSITKNFLTEIGIATKNPEVARFKSVTFLDEKPQSMFFKKLSETEYALYDNEHKFLTKGVIGQSLSLNKFKFTVAYLPFDDEATLTLNPIQAVTKTLRSKLTIKPSREDKNLLLIKCVDTDRKRSAEIVNTLMTMYENYLVEENKIIIGAQLSYLNQRQDELSSKLDQDIQTHAKVLKDNLQTQGFLGIKDEMEFILEPLQVHKTRLDEVEVELRQIDQRIAKTDLEIPLTQKRPLLIERYSKVLADQMGSVKKLLDQVHRREKIAASNIEELQPAIEEFNLALESSEPERVSKIEPLFHEFIKNLTSREKSLQESSQWIQTAQNDLSSMSIDSARKQFDQYSTQFDELHAQLKQVMFMRDRLFDPHFEISTLSNIMSDSVTQQMIQRSSELETQLHDDMHRSTRERDRLKATLAINKRFLESHLDQTLQLGKVRIDLIKEKLTSLYTVIKTLLTQEHEVIVGKIAELKQSMQALPDLWVHENRLKFKADLTKSMMEGLVGIAEAKNLSHHLYQVESRPLDKAKIPLSFIKPFLFGKTTLVFLLGVIVLTFLAIIQALIKGFPVSLTTLREIGAHTSGPLSITSPLQLDLAQDADRETLRRIATYLLENSAKGVVAIVGEKQTLFFPALTALLKKHHRTSCVIDCSFGKITTAEDQPGLYQVLNETPTLDSIRAFPSYDFLPVGASSPDAVELFKSKEFEQLLQRLSTQYEFIFLLSRTSISALESETLLDLSTHAILVAETPLENLKPYIDASRQKEKKHVTFIQIES